MIMRFRGGGVGHTSTKAATNVFKTDRDVLDLKQGLQDLGVTEPYNVEEQDDDEDITMTVDIVSEDLEGEINEDDMSESELVDYGYEQETERESEDEEEAEEEEEYGEGGEEDDLTIDELDVLGYADY
jgi:glucan phosphorylase